MSCVPVGEATTRGPPSHHGDPSRKTLPRLLTALLVLLSLSSRCSSLSSCRSSSSLLILLIPGVQSFVTPLAVSSRRPSASVRTMPASRHAVQCVQHRSTARGPLESLGLLYPIVYLLCHRSSRGASAEAGAERERRLKVQSWPPMRRQRPPPSGVPRQTQRRRQMPPSWASSRTCCASAQEGVSAIARIGPPYR